MMEIELKFLIDRGVAERLVQAPPPAGAPPAEPRTVHLRSIYHDTPDGALRAAGIALRLRHDGAVWTQTVKAGRSLRAGLSEALECEATVSGPQPDPAAISDPALAAEVLRLLGAAELSPVCETDVTRILRRFDFPNLGSVDLAIDNGELRAGGICAPLREAEFELIEGNPRAVFAAARGLLPARGAIVFSVCSKAERAALLAETGSIHPKPLPRLARAVPLHSGQTSEQAARAVLGECLSQIAANITACLGCDAPEGPHQLRIGLRRLRSAIQIFGSVLGGPVSGENGTSALRALEQEAGWLGRKVGRLRDLDVVLADIIAPELDERDPDPGMAPLAAAMVAEAEESRAALRRVLSGVRVRTFLLDFGEYVAARLWLDPFDEDQTARLARPVRQTAGAALDARLLRAANRAAGIAHLDIEERHDLRKALKSLRYAVEFLGPLHPRKKVRPFLKRLKALQAIFGDLNDAAMAAALFRDLPGKAAADPASARAAGYLTGVRTERARLSWEHAKEHWKALQQTEPFWR